MKEDLFHNLLHRAYPADLETERSTLGCLLLLAKVGHNAFRQLDEKDFYLGRDSFHGWLFLTARSARQSLQNTSAYLLQRRHKSRASELGVDNLAAEIAGLYYRNGHRTGSWIALLPKYIARLKSVRAARRAIWKSENAYQDAWKKWDENERRWKETGSS